MKLAIQRRLRGDFVDVGDLAMDEISSYATQVSTTISPALISYPPPPPQQSKENRRRSRTHHVIAHRHKKIKEQLPAALHLHLHRPAPLERAPTPDDQRQVMRPQLRIAVRRVRVRKPRTRQYRCALDPALQTLLPQREPFQFVQSVLLGGAVYQCVLEQLLACGVAVHCALHGASTGHGLVVGYLEFPAVLTLVVQEAGVVVAFVEVFEDGGEDLRGFVWEGNAFGDGFEELGADYSREEGGEGEDIFVGGEEALFGADAEGYDRGGHCAVREGKRS